MASFLMLALRTRPTHYTHTDLGEAEIDSTCRLRISRSDPRYAVTGTQTPSLPNNTEPGHRQTHTDTGQMAVNAPIFFKGRAQPAAGLTLQRGPTDHQPLPGGKATPCTGGKATPCKT